MEKREVYTVILAVLGVCILMALISLIRGDKNDSSSQVSSPEVSSIVLTTSTDYWDYLRQQQTTTTATDITGQPDETGLPQDGTDITGGSESAVSTSLIPESQSETQSQLTSVTTSAQSGYTLTVG